MIHKRPRDAGFSAVELLITLFVAAAFVGTGYQLYGVIINSGAAARIRASADNVAYDFLRSDSSQATAPCTPQSPSPPTIPTSANLPSGAAAAVSITCPYGGSSMTSKVEVTITYGSPQQEVVHAVYVSK